MNADNFDNGEWTCPTCRAPVQQGRDECPFCRTTRDGEILPSWLAIAAKHFGGALLVCVGWTAFFAFCGFICALVTGDWPFMGALTVFGVVAGVLFGIGSIIISVFGSHQEVVDDDASTAAHTVMLGGHILGALVPILKPLMLIPAALVWLTTKDFRGPEAGRGRRALVGAVVLGLLATGLLAVAYLVVGPPPPGGLKLWEAVVGILVVAAIGAVLGLVSDVS